MTGKLIRVHLTLLDEPATEKQRTVAYVEVSTELPDGMDIGQYAHQLNARCYVEEDVPGSGPSRVTVDLVPPPVVGYPGTD